MICDICPRHCKVDRTKNIGICGVGEEMIINTHSLFMFEEPCLVGKNGSGAIFFSGCTLKCVYCQNYVISHNIRGKSVSVKGLIEIMKNLEDQGAENINFVSPTHFTNQIIEALKGYKPKVPVVWNTHGYETAETIKKLLPYVDIFLTDFKYFNDKTSLKYSKCTDYADVVKQAIDIMVKNKPLDFEGDLLKQGVIIRHLILPLHTNESVQILDYIKQNYDKKVLVSVMSQFTPIFKCEQFPEINRAITKREAQTINNYMLNLGLMGYTQDGSSSCKNYIPKWEE